MQNLTIGILALQGAFDLHVQVLNQVATESKLVEKIDVVLVKNQSQLKGLDGIVLPGGESTVVEKLLISSDLDSPLKDMLEQGLPVLGTCAGLIILANHFNLLDCKVERNSYGTQIDSFETKVDFVETNQLSIGYFIRAPRISEVGPKSKVIATYDGQAVGVMQDNRIGLTFHPEVAKNDAFHHFFVEKILARVASNT